MSERQSWQHVSAMLELMSDPDVPSGLDRYVIAGVADQARKWFDSPVFCLTRSGEQGILGVYRTRAAAEAARDRCYDPSEMNIESFLVEDCDETDGADD